MQGEIARLWPKSAEKMQSILIDRRVPGTDFLGRPTHTQSPTMQVWDAYLRGRREVRYRRVPGAPAGPGGSSMVTVTPSYRNPPKSWRSVGMRGGRFVPADVMTKKPVQQS